jgi:hypothetical protein
MSRRNQRLKLLRINQKRNLALAKAARLRHVAIGLWLVLAGMVIPVLAAAGAALFWYAGRALDSLLRAFLVVCLLAAALQVAGHLLCFRVPKGVRLGPRSLRSAFYVFVKTKRGLRGFPPNRPLGFPARYTVVATLLVDVPALLLLGWCAAAKFNLLPKPGQLPDSVMLVPFVLMAPLVFFPFLPALGRAIHWGDLLSWGRTRPTLLDEVVRVVLILLLTPIAVAFFSRAAGDSIVARAIGVIVIAKLYAVEIVLLFSLARATRAYGAQCAEPKD